jgi:flagellar motor switch protein FliM
VPVPGSNAIDACPPGLLPAGLIGFFTDLQEDFLRGLARGLSEYLEATVSASLTSTAQSSCADFLAENQVDVCRVILDMEGGRGQAYLGVSAGLVSRTLGVLLAIPADSPLPPRDAVTEIEFHVMHRFFEILTQELKRAWEPSRLTFTARPMGEGAERPAEATEETLLVMNCTVKFSGGEEALRLAVPALLVRLVALQREEDALLAPAVTPHPGLLDAVRHAAVDVEAVLAGSSVRMSDLLAMEPGQILMVGQTVGVPVECRINGKVKFRGELIQTGARRAIQLTGNSLQ